MHLCCHSLKFSNFSSASCTFRLLAFSVGFMNGELCHFFVILVFHRHCHCWCWALFYFLLSFLIKCTSGVQFNSCIFRWSTRLFRNNVCSSVTINVQLSTPFANLSFVSFHSFIYSSLVFSIHKLVLKLLRWYIVPRIPIARCMRALTFSCVQRIQWQNFEI